VHSEHDVVAWSSDQMLHVWSINHALRRVNNSPHFSAVFITFCPAS